MPVTPAISTARLLLNRATEQECGEEAVQWAQASLEAGTDSPHLRMLAGADPPFNHFELARLRDLALDELGVPEVTLPEAASAVAAEMLLPFAAGECGAAALNEVEFLTGRLNWVEPLWRLYILVHEREDAVAAGADLKAFDAEARREVAAFCEHVRSSSPIELRGSS